VHIFGSPREDARAATLRSDFADRRPRTIEAVAEAMVRLRGAASRV
jgi:hypothetical protein